MTRINDEYSSLGKEKLDKPDKVESQEWAYTISRKLKVKSHGFKSKSKIWAI